MRQPTPSPMIHAGKGKRIKWQNALVHLRLAASYLDVFCLAEFALFPVGRKSWDFV